MIKTGLLLQEACTPAWGGVWGQERDRDRDREDYAIRQENT